MRVVILGAGGHGRAIAECANMAGFRTLGFIDDNPMLLYTSAQGLPVLGAMTMLEQQKIDCDGALLGIGHNTTRIELLSRSLNSGYALPTLIHPRAWCSPSARLGIATVVMANATVQTGSTVGAAVIINTNASVDHDCLLADGVHISPGAHLAGNVTIGEGTHVGIGATIIEGIRIGSHCLIAAGAVVVRDVPDGGRVAGVPARPMKPRDHG